MAKVNQKKVLIDRQMTLCYVKVEGPNIQAFRIVQLLIYLKIQKGITQLSENGDDFHLTFASTDEMESFKEKQPILDFNETQYKLEEVENILSKEKEKLTYVYINGLPCELDNDEIYKKIKRNGHIKSITRLTYRETPQIWTGTRRVIFENLR